MRVLLLGNGVLADALAGALLICNGATFVGLLSSPADRTRLLHDRTDGGLRPRMLRAGVRQYLCDGVERPAFEQRLQSLRPDLVLVASWPERVSRGRLAAASPRWVNCHPALLPRWRGENPYAAAILAGDDESGVSFHRMAEKPYGGGVLLRETVPIAPNDTGGDLRRRCAQAAAAALPRLVEKLSTDPDCTGRPQSEFGEATRCPRLSADAARLDPTRPSSELARRVRALQPWLLPWLPMQGPLHRLYARSAMDDGPAEDTTAAPGQVLAVGLGEVRIKTGDGGSLRLGRLSAGNGRVPMPAGVAAKMLRASVPATGG